MALACLTLPLQTMSYPYHQQPQQVYGSPAGSPAYVYASPQPQPTVYVQQQQPTVIMQQQPTVIMQQPAPVVYHHQQPSIIVHEQTQTKGLSDDETVMCASFFGMLGAILCIAASAESSKRR